jgi:hypothetical protein
MAAILQNTLAMRRSRARTPASRGDDCCASNAVGHLRRGAVARGLVGGVVALTFGCATTHQLGSALAPATLAALDRATAGREAFAHVEPFPGERPHVPGDRVQTVTREGLLVAPAATAPVLLPLTRVGSVSTYDHARGARDGALVGGISLALLGGVLGAVLYETWVPTCSDGCATKPDGAQLTLGFAAVFGVVGALAGAGLGVLSGHEDRYVLTHE